MRKLIVLVVAFGAMVLTAGSAMAKGPTDAQPIAGKLVITGPGLDQPIVVQEMVKWSESGWWGGSGIPSTGLAAALQNLGLLQAGPDVGWYELPPNPSTLGPAYTVQEYLDTDGKGLDAASPTTATLYPYAADRPFVYLSVPMPRSSGHKGLWWSAPPSLHSWLVAKGLPSSPPVPPAHVPLPALPKAPSSLPVILFALFGLATLVTVGAVAGRRQAARAA